MDVKKAVRLFYQRFFFTYSRRVQKVTMSCRVLLGICRSFD